MQTYDPMGRPNQTTLNIGGSAYIYSQTYATGTGRPAVLTYPSGLSVRSNYDPALGYKLSITDTAAPYTTFWTADARDAEMHLIQSTAANAVRTIQVFDPNTGRMQQIRASAVGGDDGTIAHFDYTFDTHGNLATRDDTLGAYSEAFCYDRANRLTGYWLKWGPTIARRRAVDRHIRRYRQHAVEIGRRYLLTIPIPERPILTQ